MNKGIAELLKMLASVVVATATAVGTATWQVRSLIADIDKRVTVAETQSSATLLAINEMRNDVRDLRNFMMADSTRGR